MTDVEIRVRTDGRLPEGGAAEAYRSELVGLAATAIRLAAQLPAHERGAPPAGYQRGQATALVTASLNSDGLHPISFKKEPR